MKPSEFLKRLDDARIMQAIEEAEKSTSGEIRVFVSRRTLGADSVMARAASRFEKLGMTATRERNGVLLYFIPRARQFAVIGDAGIHEKCGPDFWNDLVSRIRGRLRQGDFTEAVEEAVRMAGKLLATHFPRQADDRDELRNEIGRD